MNGIGADTTIKLTKPIVIRVATTGAIIFSALFVISLVLWILKSKKFKQTEEFKSYKEFKASLK